MATVDHTSQLKIFTRNFVCFVKNMAQSHLRCSRSKMSGLQKIAYKSLIIPYFPPDLGFNLFVNMFTFNKDWFYIYVCI